MPVFETGAFNHSATCPRALQLIRAKRLLQLRRTQISSDTALRFEEILYEPRALFRQYACPDFRPMIEPRMPEQVAD